MPDEKDLKPLMVGPSRRGAYVQLSEDNWEEIREFVRKMLLEYGLIEPSAEDE